MRTAVKPVTVRAGRGRAVERTHHIGVLHIKDDHVGDVVEGGELDATSRSVHGQALIGYSRALIAGRFRKQVIEVEGHGG